MKITGTRAELEKCTTKEPEARNCKIRLNEREVKKKICSFLKPFWHFSSPTLLNIFFSLFSILPRSAKALSSQWSCFDVHIVEENEKQYPHGWPGNTARLFFSIWSFFFPFIHSLFETIVAKTIVDAFFHNRCIIKNTFLP